MILALPFLQKSPEATLLHLQTCPLKTALARTVASSPVRPVYKLRQVPSCSPFFNTNSTSNTITTSLNNPMNTAFSATLPLGANSFKPRIIHQINSMSTNQRTPARVFVRAQRRPENVPGNLFVDSSCIDCDTCRWLAPETFHSAGTQSAVHSQPDTSELLLRALQAAAACPTGSIRTEEPEKMAREAVGSFPVPVFDRDNSVVEGVYYNGFAAEGTFGASSWLIVTEHGNIMMDCPRFSRPLAKKIDEMGGVKYLVLSHRDDVAGHDVWAERLGAERVIHESECQRYQGTDKCEIKLNDADMDYELLPGVKVLHVPGHTRGSIALLHEASKSLFTGDHFAYSARTGGLTGFPRYCSYSWGVQLENIAKLADVDFLHGFPGHGRQFHFKDEQERRTELGKAVEVLQKVAGRRS